MLVRNDEITGFFQHEERAVKADVRDVNLEGGNDLGNEKAKHKNSSCLKRSFHANPYLSQRRRETQRGKEDWDTDKHGFIGLKRQTISVDL